MNTPDETVDLITQAVLDTDHLDQNAPPVLSGEDDDYFSADPEVIFRREYSRLDTVPLKVPVPVRVYVLFLLIFASFLGGVILGLVTYPTVTITLVPVSTTVTYTTSLAIPTQSLAPVTITKSQTVPTTGHGHQDARRATGILTFYNGLFTPQTVYAGTVFTASNGVQVVTAGTVTIPAGHPPSYGQASVTASAQTPGTQGNIAYAQVNTTLANGVLVKNEAFSGGRESRDFQAVAKADLESLSATLKTALAQAIPQAFTLLSGETVTPTGCHVTTSADHGPGDEATTITMKAAETCKGVAYNTQEVETKATAIFTQQTNPGANYELLSTTQPQVLQIAPVTVRMSGTWVYTLSADYEQFLAQQIAGDNPQDARAYLLHTGVLTKVTVPAPLPKDPGHIHFILLIGA